MTTLNRKLALYINAQKPGGAPCLLVSATNSNPVSENPTWMEGSQFSLDLYFREPGADGAASTALELETSFALSVSAKEKGEEASALLVFEDGFTAEGTGETVHYSALISIPSSPELLAAFGDKSVITLSVDVDYAFGAELIPYRFDIDLHRRVSLGGGSETAAQPGLYLRSDTGDTVWKVTIDDNGQPSYTRIL